MPLVNVRLIEGVFTPEQKSEMIHQLTETMVEAQAGRQARTITLTACRPAGLSPLTSAACQVTRARGQPAAGAPGQPLPRPGLPGGAAR